MKKILIQIFKFSFAIGIIVWLRASGKLDFKLLQEIHKFPHTLFIGILLFFINIFLISIRWRKILSARLRQALPLWGIVKVNWIGQFFSSVLPGSVSGDFIKMIYIKNYIPEFSKSFIFASIFLDRLMGLFGLISLVGLSSLIFGQSILQNAPDLKPLLQFNFILFFVVVFGLINFFFFNQLIRNLLSFFNRGIVAPFTNKLILLWDDLVVIKFKILKAVALSVLVQFISVLLFWSLIFPFVGNQMNFIQALAFVPLGHMVLALPIAPSGLGFGHAIFQKLFEFCGINNGASLFNLYFIFNLALNLLGLIPYLTSKTNEKKSIRI